MSDSVPRYVGMTLVECLIALAIVTVAVLVVTSASTSGHRHQQYSDNALRAVRLAEHLLEEIQGRPYAGTGVGRPLYHLSDYDNFQESAGQLKDFSNALHDTADQGYSRAVSISDSIQTIASLENSVVVGKTVTVTVQDLSGAQWELSRFIPEPESP